VVENQTVVRSTESRTELLLEPGMDEVLSSAAHAVPLITAVPA
jgi:hypothetical protein